MSAVYLRPEESVLVVIDLQPRFISAMHQMDRLVDRSLFLAKVAELMEVPVLVTEHNFEKMGGTLPGFEMMQGDPIRKMEFSAAQNQTFLERLAQTGRKKVVIVGIETHICVSLTALDLLQHGYEVVVCPDAVSSRTEDRHKLGMERMRDAGVVPAHSESVAYEWMQSASDPKFRDMLTIVKAADF